MTFQVASVGDPLAQIASWADEIGASRIREETNALRERLAEHRFYLAVIGQYKRGKSSLINALLGEPVLPVGVVPVTAVVTILRYGKERRILVWFTPGGNKSITSQELPEYVTEKQNPGNKKQVALIEVFQPSDILKSGVCLVDTPGVGSVFIQSNEITRQFLPQIDAGIVVLGADPPISGEELSIVEDISQDIPELIFVLSKVDRVSESDRKEAIEFSEEVISDRIKRPLGTILEVSSQEVVSSGKASRDWNVLTQKVKDLTESKRYELLASAGLRGLKRLASSFSTELTERQSVLQLSLTEMARRLEELYKTTYKTERALRHFGYVFMYRKDKADEWFQSAADGFLRDNRAEIRKIFEQGGDSETLLVKNILSPWAMRLEPKVKRTYSEVASIYDRQVNELLEQAFPGKPSSFPMEELPEREFEVGVLADKLIYRKEGFLSRLSNRSKKGAASRFESALDNTNREIVESLRKQLSSALKDLEAFTFKRLQKIAQSTEQALEYAKKKNTEGPGTVDLAKRRLAELQEGVRKLLTEEDMRHGNEIGERERDRIISQDHRG